MSADEAVAICDAGGIAPTLAITVRSVAGQKYDRIVKHQLGPIPPRMDGSDERGDALEPTFAAFPDDEVPF